ncbi:hypothetical protein RclHR1_01900007 [Rhizophagus clarus]|uniref:Ceramidase n=1 Tax=Rhizophagus clarus TaxID=94130 RepID=A0A2Z6QSU2_9GLOM|nr:hypothetical protein RclHR1_01900007 [Rhizophagus clarus]
MDYNNNSVEGFWGKPTSTDWCEKNYDVTHYIAEFFNTLSSLCMISAGVFGMIMHSKGFEFRYSIAFASIIVVGIGSILFHGTLLFSLQLFDEIPMMFCILILLYNVVENKSQKKFGIWFPLLLICWGVGITSVMVGSGKEYDNEFMQDIEFYVFQGKKIYEKKFRVGAA